MTRILDRQKYHGAALIQVAEHEEFTSINRIALPGTRAHNAFSVNGEIGIFLKYALSLATPIRATPSRPNTSSGSRKRTWTTLRCSMQTWEMRTQC